MSEARIGRVVAAALHQALADDMPMRLEFYENWLKPMRMREGRIGIASFNAVLSFLRRDGDAWEPVMERAGHYAAEWTFAALPWPRRALLCRLPQALRLRQALRLSSRLIDDTVSFTRADARRRRQERWMDIRRSAFCDVRETASAPLCGFYVAAIARLCQLLGVQARIGAIECHAMGAACCRIAVEPSSATQPVSATRDAGVQG